MLGGGCFCGAVRYEVRGEVFHSTLCHCVDCRRVTGAPAVAWFSVAAQDFTITAGTLKRFQSSAEVERGFCETCGTALTYQHSSLLTEIDVTSCSLDAPEGMPPKDHTQTGTQLTWMRMADGLTQYPAGRTDI